MNVGQVCTRGAVSVSASVPLSEVAQEMYDRHIGAVVVTKSPMDRPVVVGIITDRDIVRAQLDHAADLTQLRTEDIMTRDPLVLNERDSIANAVHHLQARGVRRAPVISDDGALVGLISTDDLLAHVGEELLNLAYLVGQQARREPA